MNSFSIMLDNILYRYSNSSSPPSIASSCQRTVHVSEGYILNRFILKLFFNQQGHTCLQVQLWLFIDFHLFLTLPTASQKGHSFLDFKLMKLPTSENHHLPQTDDIEGRKLKEAHIRMRHRVEKDEANRRFMENESSRNQKQICIVKSK